MAGDTRSRRYSKKKPSLYEIFAIECMDLFCAVCHSEDIKPE
jgi:hypothetical protein